MIALQEAYRKRPIRFLELWEQSGWRLKVYGIAYQGEYPRTRLIEKAKELASEPLPLLAGTEGCYGVGFLGVHDGRGADFVFIDWWAEENELHHHVYMASHNQPDQFQYVTPTGLIACVWDLRVLCFERGARLQSVLANPNGADLDHYVIPNPDDPCMFHKRDPLEKPVYDCAKV